jgi:hypothetical protein
MSTESSALFRTEAHDLERVGAPGAQHDGPGRSDPALRAKPPDDLAVSVEQHAATSLTEDRLTEITVEWASVRLVECGVELPRTDEAALHRYFQASADGKFELRAQPVREGTDPATIDSVIEP